MIEATSGRLGIWYWWLATVYGASCVVGLLLVIAPFSPVMATYNRALAETFWNAGDFPDQARRYHHWAMAVIGSTTAGWAVTNLWILRYAFRDGALWAHRALVSGLLTWAVLDLAVSLQLGAYVEAAFVLSAALLALVPLVATRGLFTRAAGAASATDVA